MKKQIISLVVAIVLMTGCATDAKPTETTSATTSEQTTAPATTTTKQTTSTPKSTTTRKTTTSKPVVTEPIETINEKTDEEREAYKNSIIKEIADTVPYDDIYVKNDENGLSVEIYIDGESYITTFGNYIVDSKAAFEKVFEGEKTDTLTLCLFNGVTLEILFSNSSLNGKLTDMGEIFDYRSGTKKTTYIFSIDDLCEIFPATRQYIGKQDVDIDRLKIYEEVMDVLNSQFDRPENEILEELAPKYEMTADELKQLLRDVMSEIYS